jgi:hypothetical protein
MSVSISEPRSRARLKKSSVEFNVGIENKAAIKRESALEAVNRISGIQRGQEITAREKRRVFYRLARRQEHCSSLGGSISNVNVREGITWPLLGRGCYAYADRTGEQAAITGNKE